MQERTTGNLGEILLREGMISMEQLDEARKRQAETGRSLGSTLVEMNLITEKMKLTLLQKKLGCGVLSLRGVELTPELIRILPRLVAKRHQAIPVRLEGDTLVLAMDDPSDLTAVDSLSSAVGRPVRAMLAASKEIEDLLERYPEEGEGVARAPRRGLRFLRSLSFWFFLLAPLAGFFIYTFFLASPKFQKGLLDFIAGQVFDFAIYIMLIWGMWSIIVFYVNDVIFDWLQGGPQSAGETERER